MDHLEGAVDEGFVQVDDHALLVTVLKVSDGQQVLGRHGLQGWRAAAIGVGARATADAVHRRSVVRRRRSGTGATLTAAVASRFCT